MPYSTYRSLPIDALYDLLTLSVVDLLATLESKPYNERAIRELRTQIQALLALIGERKERQRDN